MSDLSAYLSGREVDSIRIADASITTAKIDDLSISTSKIIDGEVGNAKIVSVSANKVTTGYISSSVIAAGSITVDKLDVSELSAITANLGTVTAGGISSVDITASYFSTSTGGNRIEVSTTNRLLFYESNALRAWVSDSLFYLLRGTNDANAAIGFTDNESVVRGSFMVSSDNQAFLVGSASAGVVRFQSLNGDVRINRIIGDDSDGTIYIFCNEFKINGSTKTAIVPTSRGYRALYCVESPEVWFFDIMKSDEQEDPLFTEVTHGETHTITNRDGSKIIFRRRKGMENIRFKEKTREQYILNENRWSNK